jgi:ABC-type branched-subunit amino acid transport system substrate-binding protein
MKRLSCLLLILALGSSLKGEELRLAILGNIPESKSIETMAVHFAVDAENAKPELAHPKVKLAGFHSKGTVEGALEAAKKLVEDPQVMGVVVHGEEGADPQVLKVLEDAGLAVVLASSWEAPRPDAHAAANLTWLSPSQVQLAEIAATYARKGTKAAQVAVLDNGAPTSAAAAKAFGDRFKELGGRVNFEGEWQGSDWGLTRTVKALKANWPQMIFFAGEGKEAGILVKAIRKERELKATTLLGLPSLFDPAFIDQGRMDTRSTTVVFPSPQYRSSALFSRNTGVSFAKNTPNWKAYVGYSQRAGRWAGMVFDGAQLLLEAMDRAAAPPAAASSLSSSASAASATTMTATDASATASVQATPERDLSNSAAVQAAPLELTRASVAKALAGISGYKGIRGLVHFNEQRQPADPKAMVFYALPKVNTREMRWYDKQYGPPFNDGKNHEN